MYPCPSCPKVFSTKQARSYHKQQKHQDMAKRLSEVTVDMTASSKKARAGQQLIENSICQLVKRLVQNPSLLDELCMDDEIKILFPNLDDSLMMIALDDMESEAMKNILTYLTSIDTFRFFFLFSYFFLDFLHFLLFRSEDSKATSDVSELWAQKKKYLQEIRKIEDKLNPDLKAQRVSHCGFERAKKPPTCSYVTSTTKLMHDLDQMENHELKLLQFKIQMAREEISFRENEAVEEVVSSIKFALGYKKALPSYSQDI